MEETRNEEMMMETEIKPVEDYNYTTEESKSNPLVKAVIIGACGVGAGAVAFGLKKLKQYNEKKTIERLRKEGWIVEAPEDPEAEVVDADIVSEEEIPDLEGEEIK